MNTIGDRLRQRRESTGLSQGQVAQYEGISQSYLSEIERGRKNPTVWSLLARLAKRYHTSADYLLGLTDDPSPPKTSELPEAVRNISSVALQLSDKRRRETLRLLQTLLEMEREEGVAVQEELATLKRLFDTGEEANIRLAAAKLLELLSIFSGIDTQTVLE